jgi:uncharacterized protein YodC (DUF2158 family)
MLEIGDLVRLNSGGPLMTVAAVDGDQINCVWFRSDHVPQKETFSKALLTKVSPDVRVAASALTTALQLRVAGRTWNFSSLLRNPFARSQRLSPASPQPVDGGSARGGD